MTSLPVLQNRPESTPDCFGQMWDPKEAACFGGLDMLYTSKTGSHIRERCRFFDACGAKLQASRNASLQRPPIQSFHFPAPVQPPPIRPVTSAAANRAVAPMSQPMAMQPYQPQVPQQHQQYQPPPGAYHPAPTYQFNHGIPNYISVAEPRAADESIWAVLFRELIRAVLKSLGHTVSYFADRTPIKQLPPPPPQ